jgi:hypothetical protein
VREFWVSSGHHLTTRLTPDGRLAVTDELLLAWLARPELKPPRRRLYRRARAARRLILRHALPNQSAQDIA